MTQRTKAGLQANLAADLADNTTGDISAADVRNNLVDFTDSVPFLSTADNTLSGSFSGSFQGDGSNLTGVTGEWDGSLNGNASITGSLTVTGNTTLGDAITDKVFITGSLNMSGSGTGTIIDIKNTGYGSSGVSAVNILSSSPNKIASLTLGSAGGPYFYIAGTSANSSYMNFSSDSGNGHDLDISVDTILSMYAATASLSSYSGGAGITLTDKTAVVGPLEVTGSLTVTGNTTLGDAITDRTYVSGSIVISSDTTNTANAIKITNASHDRAIGATSINVASNSTQIPGIAFRNQDDTNTLIIARNAADGVEIVFNNDIGGDFEISNANGDIIFYASAFYINTSALPTSEPSTSGQLWLSGSAGSNSKILCVRD